MEIYILRRPRFRFKLYAYVCSKLNNLSKLTGFQLDWNLLRTFCPSSPNFVGTFGNFLGHFFNTNFYHHKRKLPSALLKLKPGVVLLPFRMVSAVRLIVWLFISWGEWSLSIVVGGSGWGTVFFCFLRPLHDSLATENDCSGNDGAGKLFWCIKNYSSCCFLVAIKFYSHFIGKYQFKYAVRFEIKSREENFRMQ